MRSEEELARAGLSSEPFPLLRPFEELHAEKQQLRDEAERLRLLREAHNAHVKHDWCPICDTESST